MTWSACVTPTEDRSLDSGLRVVLTHRPGLDFAVVLTQMRGGSRADPTGVAGTAHLTEHLLAKGIGPDGQPWSVPLLAAGADLAGTTHPDYMEFCTEVPYAVLPLALRAEQARLAAWPDLHDGVFERQRSGVCQEIRDHRSKRATRNLPWPALGPLIFDTWADSHDPFGETDHVQRLTEADCRRFFDQHHRPDRTVLVVVADLTRVAGGAEAVFATLEVPTRGSSQVEPITGPGRAPSTGVHTLAGWTAPHSVGAIGWRVPSVAEDPNTYAALLAVAAQLRKNTGARVRLGQMSPMDRALGDVLTVTVQDPRDARDPLERARTEPLYGLEQRPGEVREAIRRARTVIAARLDQPRTTAQILGRALTLAGDPYAAGQWVEAVQTLEPQDVFDAVRQLSETEPVAVIGRPTALAPRFIPSQAEPEREQLTRLTTELTQQRQVQMVTLDMPSLTAALAARLSPASDLALVRELSALGYQLTQDSLGWLLERQFHGSAHELAGTVRRDLSRHADVGAHVQHVVLTGRHAARALPWTVPHLSAPDDDHKNQQGHHPTLELHVADDLPQGIASAELHWAVQRNGFIHRWAGIALLVSIHARDADGLVNPLNAPSGTFIALRQEPAVQGPELIADVYAAPERLPAAMQHLAAELTPSRLERRGKHATEVAAVLAAGWQRDAAAPASLARRGSVVLDLGGTSADIRGFVRSLRAASAEEIIHQIRFDTSQEPWGTVTTSVPETFSGLDLPWSLELVKQS